MHGSGLRIAAWHSPNPNAFGLMPRVEDQTMADASRTSHVEALGRVGRCLDAISRRNACGSRVRAWRGANRPIDGPNFLNISLENCAECRSWRIRRPEGCRYPKLRLPSTAYDWSIEFGGFRVLIRCFAGHAARQKMPA